MAQKITQKSLKHDEFVDAAFDVGEWIRTHLRQVAMGAGAIVAIVLIVSGWLAWSKSAERAGKKELAEGMHHYGALEAPAAPGQLAPPRDYARALSSFEKAAKAGGSAPYGQIAEFYRGASLLRLGRAAEAAGVLDGVARSAKDPAIVTSARALLAQAYVAANDDEKAVAVLRELSQPTATGYPPAMALLDLGKVLTKQGKTAEAKQAWQDLLARYPQGAEAGEARTLLEGATTP